MTAAAHPILDAFPKRPIRMLRSPMLSPLANVLIMLMCLGFAGLFLWLGVPGVVRDFRISEAPVVVRDADISDGRCTTHTVLVDCSAKVSYRVAGVSYQSEPSVMFFSFEGYDRASVVRSRDKPGLATLDIALDQLWNRIITTICFSGLFLALAIYILTLLPEARRWRRLVNEQASVGAVPIIVEITSSRKNYGQTSCYISYDDNGRKRKAQINMRKEKPFVVGSKGGRALALAVSALPGDRPLLLNENLTAIELSDAERNDLRAARNALG
jgi:hypothetical protein